jgi:hypothetical protein
MNKMLSFPILVQKTCLFNDKPLLVKKKLICSIKLFFEFFENYFKKWRFFSNFLKNKSLKKWTF